MSTAHRDGPFFNLKAVLQQTGLKADTLRAWERRYGLPTPDRSTGKHRLYSQHDIDAIAWLVARQHEGLSISRAVDQWRQLEALGRDPLDVPLHAGFAPAPAAARAAGSTVVQLREEWVAACKGFDEQRAEEVLSQAFALYPPASVCLELIQEGIAEIGDAWYGGEATVSQEHFASSLAIRRLESLILAAPLPIRPGRILVACPPDEHHVLGVMLLTFLLRRRGWAVVYLGADVPVDQITATVVSVRPQLVILGAQRLHTAARLLEAARALDAQNVPLAYGGLVFNGQPALCSRIPGHFLGTSVESAAQTAEALVLAPRQHPPGVPLPRDYALALEHFREREGLIAARMNTMAPEMGITPRHLAIANHEMSLSVQAALALGDLNLLGADLRWLEGMLSRQQETTTTMPVYVSAYLEAAKANLDERAGPLLSWLRSLLADKGQA